MEIETGESCMELHEEQECSRHHELIALLVYHTKKYVILFQIQLTSSGASIQEQMMSTTISHRAILMPKD